MISIEKVRARQERQRETVRRYYLAHKGTIAFKRRLRQRRKRAGTYRPSPWYLRRHPQAAEELRRKREHLGWGTLPIGAL